MTSQESPPEPTRRRRPALWWSLFVIWTIMILAFVPYANAIQKRVSDEIGGQGIRWALVGVVALAAAAGLRWIARRRATIGPLGVLRMATVPALAAWWMASMEHPAEAFHIIEYGVLGAVAYRACAFHTGGFRAYAAAAVLTTLAGGLDELVQWLTPGRFGDPRDVALDAAAGALALLWLATAFAPKER